jgi:hypothetical protein
VEPLFLAAIKYRRSARRRQAVEPLRRTGLEGPWDGKLLAAVATRIIEIEEENVDLQALEEAFPEHISERPSAWVWNECRSCQWQTHEYGNSYVQPLQGHGANDVGRGFVGQQAQLGYLGRNAAILTLPSIRTIDKMNK